MTNPPSPPYTEATRDAVAQIVADHRGCFSSAIAAAVLNALVKAGLLLPEGAETRTEWGVETTFPDGPSTLPVVGLWEAKRQVSYANRAFPQRVMERTTWSTGWVPTAEGGGEADQVKDLQ